MKITNRTPQAQLSALLPPGTAGRQMHAAGIVRTIVLVAAFLAAIASTASAQSPNLGDPLFCQPNEGTTFLIVNGGAGVFTVDQDCYGNNVNNDTTLVITTSQNGTLAGTRSAGNINYVYIPPTPGFTGLDTFSLPVTTVFNSAGGTGSNCATCTSRPGGAATLSITLNVIPATATLNASGATPVPVPAGSVTSCSASQGNAGQGPPPGTVLGCVTGIVPGTLAPSHGTLTIVGSGLQYTPNAGFFGTDTFQYQAEGVNTDGTFALNSGNVTVTVAVTSMAPDPPYRVKYATNLGAGESYIDIVNDGAQGASLQGPGEGPAIGNICVSVYAIDPNEELVSCCACLITPDQTIYLGANADLLSNPATGGAKPTSITIKLVASTPTAGVSPTSCANEAALSTATLVNGIIAWGTTLHAAPNSTTTYATTESPFISATLSVSELASLTGRCAAIIGNESGSGICNSCHLGALGASKK